MKKTIMISLVLVLLLSLVACGAAPSGETPVDMDMNAVYTQMGQTVTIPEMLTLNESLMLDYCGIRSEDVAQAVVVICADSLRTDEIWLLEAVNEDAAQKLVDLANKRLTKKGEESVTYSPAQYAVVQKAQLLQEGNYIALIVSPDSEAMAQVFLKAAGK